MSSDFRIVVLISGRGSNLKSLIQGAQHYKITRVISNKRGAPGLLVATERGIPTVVAPRDAHPSLEAQKAAILEAVQTTAPDLVVLAGFMQIVSPSFVAAYRNRIINIHPALLPKFVGLDTHARAIAAGEKEHGCTVHLVDDGVDTGAILAQSAVPIVPAETPESLAQKVLAREHLLYPWVVNAIAEGALTLDLGQPNFSAALQKEAREMGFQLFGAKGRAL